MSEKVELVKSSVWAIGSQAVSMVSGILMSFILPKFISVESFGYWQLFLLYAGYVGILHFGYADGVYLRLGGKYFEQLEKTRWYPQIHLVIFFQIIFAIALVIYAVYFEEGVKRNLFLFLSAYLVIDNIYKLLSFILMATGKMVFYSKTVILDKLLMAVTVAFLLIAFPAINLFWIISAYTIAHFLILIMTVGKFDKLLRYTKCFSFAVVKDTLAIASVGIVLTMSNIMSTFVAGSCRFLVEHFWNIEIFAQISFALIVSSFLLFFISQISYVLFPFIRRTPKENQGVILRDATFILTSFPMYAFSTLFLLYGLIYYWLPDYREALRYFILLSPICLYDIRINLLYNTYYKNLNKIKELLIINVITVATAVLVSVVAVWLRNMDILAIGIVVAISLKSVLMHLQLFKYYQIGHDTIFYFDLLFSALIILSFAFTNLSVTLVVYLVMIACLTVFYRNKLKDSVTILKKII